MAPHAADPIARRLRWAAALVALVGMGVLAYVLVAHDPPKVTPKALAASVETRTGSPGLFGSRCARTGPSAWRCTVSDAGSGGGATYTVRVSSDACWNARLFHHDQSIEGTPMPATVSGCLH
jgi:hypothetical protein